MSAYYNEIDPFAAAWLRELIAQGHIAHGIVDTRSISDVQPDDLVGYSQCHFFAGIGGWSYALRLAGWDDDRPVWTGSCPCQPFSDAGAGRGFADDRHLWPAWFRLIKECRPATIFGEQVASKDALEWVDLVQTDLEGTDHAFAAFDLCAAGVGAPHIRQRLYWMAVAYSERREGIDALLRQEAHRRETSSTVLEAAGRSSAGIMGNASSSRLARRSRQCGDDGSQFPAIERAGGWLGAEYIEGSDGKSRPVEPGTFPLAPRLPDHVGRLRGYGNAIVPQVAAEIIGAYMEYAA